MCTVVTIIKEVETNCKNITFPILCMQAGMKPEGAVQISHIAFWGGIPLQWPYPNVYTFVQEFCSVSTGGNQETL